MQFFVTGIGTEVGKTVISAILTEALEADYWKPIQSGDLDYTDSDKVKDLISNKKTIFHPEAYRLRTPASPHLSAALDGIEIQANNFRLPETANHLIVEGAGGLMVPLNSQFLIIDLIKQLQVPVILVSRNYLGSINHTILSIEALHKRAIPIAGIIFNGAPELSDQDYILNYTQIPYIGQVEEASMGISKQFIDKQAAKIKKNISKLFKLF